MPALADEIGNDPVLLALLNPPELQGQQLPPPKATPEEHREHRVIAELARYGRCPLRQQSPSLIRGEPVPQPDPEPAHALHAPNTGRELRTEQPGIGRFIGHPAHRGESEVNRGRGIVVLFEVDPIASTTVRLNARRGSEQYHVTNSRMAWSYVRWPLAEVKLLRTAAFDCSRSGNARTRFGAFLRRGLAVDLRIGDGLQSVAWQIPPISPLWRYTGLIASARR
ncbi:MAG TPA: hypothetical protein VGY48_26585 [Vicinamibacterales bacterium]|nr:hypothetical protein [Vicinamibacterales bacterium]